jgi:PilZ domain
MTSAVTQIAQQESQTFKGESRRITRRYAVRMPVQYRISRGELQSAWKSGQTLDMSVGGIYMGTSEPVPAGSTLELAIEWPRLYHDRPIVRLHVSGSVVRNDGRGTALRILSHEFRYVRATVVPSRRVEGNMAVPLPAPVQRVRFAGR